MAFCSSNQTSSSTIVAIHETQDRTLLTVILRFTTFFILVNYLAKNVNSAGALANFSLCSAVHPPFAKKKEKSQHIWNPSLHLGSHCTALKILGLRQACLAKRCQVH